MANNKNTLLATLPPLSQSSGKWLPSYVVEGLKTGLGRSANPNELVQFRTGQNIRDQFYVIRPGVDASRTNAYRRFVMEFGGARVSYMRSLNRELLGGEDYPVTMALLGIATGAVSAGAGALFSLATAVVSDAKPKQSIQVRDGDQLWQIEQLGKANGEIIHSSCFVVVDPLRKEKNLIHSWVIHERRNEVVIA